jgi:hypothetical protein
MGKTDFSPSAFWQSYWQSHVVANQDEMGEENDEFCSYF